MLRLTQLIGLAGGRGRALKTANAVDYDGGADYLSRASDLAGNADSRQGILSFWVRLDGGDGATMQLLSGNPGTGATVSLSRSSSNNLQFQVFNSALTSFIQRNSAGGTFTASAAWKHVLLSWDTDFSAGNKLLHFYVDGTDVGTSIADSSAAFDIDYTVAGWSVAATTTGSGVFNGALAELYFAPGQYLDFSQEGNREAFRSSSGKPVDLGPTGSDATGTAPILYLPNPAASAGTNAGTGGNFTINGSPATASTSPSD